MDSMLLVTGAVLLLLDALRIRTFVFSGDIVTLTTLGAR